MEVFSLDRLSTEQGDGDVVFGDVVDSTSVGTDESLEHQDDQLSDFMNLYVEYCVENLFKLFPRQEDAQIADAILDIFKKRHSISIFNKKALYIYIREHIDVKTPKITKVANELGDIFKKQYIFYLQNGYAQF